MEQSSYNNDSIFAIIKEDIKNNSENGIQKEERCNFSDLCEKCDIICNITFFGYEGEGFRRIVSIISKILFKQFICNIDFSCVCFPINVNDETNKERILQNSHHSCSSWNYYKKITKLLDAFLSKGTENNFAIIQLFDPKHSDSPFFDDFATYRHPFEYFKFKDSINNFLLYGDNK